MSDTDSDSDSDDGKGIVGWFRRFRRQLEPAARAPAPPAPPAPRVNATPPAPPVNAPPSASTSPLPDSRWDPSPRGPRAVDDPSWRGRSATHLWWYVENQAPVVRAEVTIEILEPPQANFIYFWAMQLNFTNGSQTGGGGHIGLQWHPYYPDCTAVNWGGYCSHDGSILRGSDSSLPGSTGDVNTRDYPWQPGTRYKMSVYRAIDSAPTHAEIRWPKAEPIYRWRGEITDLSTNQRVVVRDLYSSGHMISGPAVWSEIFAKCDSPRAAVRWSDFVCVTETGQRAPIRKLGVTHGVGPDGGCENSDVVWDGVGAVMSTATPRTTPHGAQIELPQ